MSFLYEKRCASRGGACDSSQMSSLLCHDIKNEVQEEEFVKEDAQTQDAVPFNDLLDQIIVITNGKIVNATEVLECDIMIENGKISKVEKNIEVPEGAQVIDAKDKYILPGAIDYDTRILQKIDLENIGERTKAFILGGITTIADVLENEDFDKSKEILSGLAASSLYCDMTVKLFTKGEKESVEKEVETAVQEFGINTFQMCPEEIFLQEDGDLLDLLKVLRKHGCALTVDTQQGRWRRRSMEGNSISAPVEDLEETTVRKLCALALQVDIPVSFMNLTTPDGAALVDEYSKQGLTVYGEVLTVYGEVLTQIRSMKSLNLEDGNLLLSSHQSFISQDGATADSEDWLSVVYNEFVSKEEMDITKFVELTSSNPAKLLNLYPRKGCIAEDSDADLVIFDPMKTQTVSLQSSARFNIPKQSDILGVPEYVLIGGKVVVSDCQLRGIKTHGQFLSLKPFPSVENETLKARVRKPLQRLDRPGDENLGAKDEVRGWDRRKLAAQQQGEIFDKELGIYQRPLSAHGVKNQQDSTFTVKTFF